MIISIWEKHDCYAMGNFMYIRDCYKKNLSLIGLHPAIFLEMDYADADFFNRHIDISFEIIGETKVETTSNDPYKLDYAINVLGAEVNKNTISLIVNNDLLRKVYDLDIMLDWYKKKIANKKPYLRQGYLTKSQFGTIPETIVSTLILQGYLYQEKKNHFVLSPTKREEIDEDYAFCSPKLIYNKNTGIARYVY